MPWITGFVNIMGVFIWSMYIKSQLLRAKIMSFISTSRYLQTIKLEDTDYRHEKCIDDHELSWNIDTNMSYISTQNSYYRILKYYQLQNKSSLKKCAMLVLCILYISAFIFHLSYASLSKSNGCAHRYLDDSFRNLLLT